MKIKSVIQTSGLSKRYGSAEKLALDNLNVVVNKGEVYGFLGPNGAGKSTAIRLLLNFIQPTMGSATIQGKDIVKDSVAIKSSVGYLAGELVLYPKMSGEQFLNYMEQLQPPRNKAYKAELIKRFEFGTQLKMRVRDLSKGNRQKLGIIQAFMHEPDILILDEPTSGLDPLMQEEFFKLLYESKTRGACVFVSSHNLAEVQKMCDRVGFIRAGKLIAEQDINKLAATTTHTFDINFNGAVPRAALNKIKNIKVSVISENHAAVTLKGDLAPLFSVLAKQSVMGISQREANLEQEFLHYYRGYK